jgi:alkanesulfonate monooxygenase SsuD/methylene tetrahydromethanopterin reductase-like flavin-dependent oxidoreductase (luciferase family)
MEIGCQLPMQGPVATRDALMTFARQAEAHGMAPLWPFQIRGKQADEMLRVFKELWTSEHPTFEGEFYRVRDIGFAPKPVQKPHPPIWVGDSAGAFRRVVGLGDGRQGRSRAHAGAARPGRHQAPPGRRSVMEHA